MIRRRTHDEDGMVTAFVVIFVMALMLMAGLVIDGGMVLAAKRNAVNEAEGAARAGAQAVDVGRYRQSGVVVLNADQARRAAQSYIDATGHTGTVAVIGDQVNVTITQDEPARVLSIAGLTSFTVHGAGTARAVRGIEVPE